MAVRCMHESKMHSANSFVTLTYSDEFLPENMSLEYRHFQLFMKRLRRAVGPVRFYMCGEYGETYGRPHFHACLFGFRPGDLRPWRKSGAGFQLYRSPFLERVWDQGNCEVGEVTFESAAYCARYIAKKVTGERAEAHYSAVVAETGEIVSRTAEFSRMSLKPGIGASWFAKYGKEVFPQDRVVVRGHECKPPRYYEILYGRGDEEALEKVKEARRDKLAEVPLSEFRDDRINAKDTVLKAKLKKLHRSVE